MENIIQLISDYHDAVNRSVKVFQETYGISDIMRDGLHRKLYPRTGSIKEKGIYQYAFHGIGLWVRFKDVTVDVDFAWFPEFRYDGFDLWRLTGFITENAKKYPDITKEKLETAFEILIKTGVIRKPKPEFQSSLYFFTDTL